MPSFDVVCKTDLAEVDNAIANLRREIEQRYDFKGSTAKIERNEAVLTLSAEDGLKLNQLQELLRGHLARRKIDARVLDFKTPQKAAGQSVRQEVVVRQGIEAEIARRVIKEVKSGKVKVQIAVQGDDLRVSGKKRDDLQAVIARIKGLEVDLPLQFVNFRD
jgi:hypothetical protein